MEEQPSRSKRTNPYVRSHTSSRQKQPNKKNRSLSIVSVMSLKHGQSQRNLQPPLNNKDLKKLSRNAGITLVKLCNKTFDHISNFQWSFQNSVYIADYQLMVFNIQTEDLSGPDKKLQIRIEIPLLLIKQKIEVYQYQEKIYFRFQAAYRFTKVHSTNSWKRDQDVQNGSISMKFEFKGFQELRQFLKNNLDSTKYQIKSFFKPMEQLNKKKALVFNQNLKKECLTHKQKMLFGQIKIPEVIQSQEKMDCPIKTCGKSFQNATQLSRHLQTTHPFLQKYGIRLNNFEGKTQLHFSEQLLNFILIINRQNSQEITKIMQKLSK